MNRQVTVAVALAVLVASTGCLGVLTGDDLTFSASEATVEDGALDQSDYEEVSVESSEASREFSAAGQSRNVTLTNWVSMYERTVSIAGITEQRAAVFSAFSTPQVSVLGQTFNPIDDYSNRELAELAQQRYEGLSIGQTASTRTVTVLNESSEVSKFEGTATLNGQEVDVYVHVTKVKHDGDIVAAISVHPQQLEEQSRIDTLLENLEH